MTASCPGCGSELYEQNSQRYCGSCGEPINVDVDRDTIRSRTDGFLDPQDASRIVDSVRGERGPHHDYTHVTVQEQVRHAVYDFWVLNKWEEFDNRDALLADLGRRDTGPSEEEDLDYVIAILGLFDFLFTSVSMKFIAGMVFRKVRQEFEAVDELSDDQVDELDLSLCLTVDGDEIAEDDAIEVEIESDDMVW